MKRILFIVLLILIGFASQSQEYTNSLGVRGTYAFGITGKHFIEQNKALEGILTFGYGGYNITGLYEIHAPAFDVKRLYWYYGGGAHIGQIHNTHPVYSDMDDGDILIGFDGIIGLEYDIEEIPITISADWKPTLNLTGYGSGFWGGLSFRYTFPQ